MKSALLTFPSLSSSRRRALLLAGVLALASVLTLGLTPISAITATLTIRPNSGGSFTEWALYPDGTNWGSVDEVIQNGDADYVYINVSAKADSYNFQNVTQTGSILNVRVCTYAKQTIGNEKLKQILVIDGAKNYGVVEHTPATNTYLLYINDWPNNPVTNSSWTWSETNSLEAGIESVGVGGWEGEIRVTQVFIEVTVTGIKPPMVSVSPASMVGPPPDIYETFSVNITVTDVLDLYSWQVGMTFNATVVEALSLLEGTFLKQGGNTIITNGTIDNTAGIIYRHSCSLTGPVPGVTGNGTLATVIFKVKRYGNSTLHLADVILLDSSLTEIPTNVTDGYFEIEVPILDVYTQRAGLGPMAPGDAFSPGERVELTAHLTYGGANISGVNVAFQVDDPTGAVFVFGSDVTDDDGLATINFRLSLDPMFGAYSAYATASYMEYMATDIVTFYVGWIVEIVSVTSCNISGGPQTSFARGSMAYFNVTIRNHSLQPKMALMTISAFDKLEVVIGVTSIEDLVDVGTLYFMISVPIPMWAWPGTATCEAGAFTDWPVAGGVPYCPSVSSAFWITLG